MTKHKRFHSIHTKAQAGKAYSFFHAGRPYGSIPRKPKLTPHSLALRARMPP